MDATSFSQATLQSSGEDSSKSTGSKGSGAKTQDDKERDLEKDNAASPIDLECHIQEERITKILDDAIYKTKLAVCLPDMIENHKVLSSKLSSHDMDDVVFIFTQYDNPMISPSLLNIATLDDIKAGDVSLKNRLSPELGHLLYILNSCPALADHVVKKAEKMKTDYLSTSSHSLNEPQPALEYLLALERLKEIMIKQMSTTAAEELSQKLNTRRLEVSNAKLVEQIKELTETINNEQAAFDVIIKEKNELIARLESELEVFNKAANAKLEKKVLDSDTKMVMMSRSHAVKKEVLKEEEIETREGYDRMLHQHMTEEKAQRARRFKVQTQLLSWLQKYDTEMADKQHEHDELEKKFEDESRQVEELEKKIEEQEIEYLPLMKAREDEYHEEMTRKMKEHQLEHAATVIQNAWRQVMANRNEKRKLRKKWKAVKKERDRQQRIADAREVRARKEAAKTEKLAKKAAKDALTAREVPT